MKFWANEFKYSRRSLENAERSEGLKTATGSDNIAEIHQMVLNDRRNNVRKQRF